MVIDQEKLAKLQAATRSGGKGTPRRKVVRKPKGASVGAGEDKKLQLALKKLNVQPVTGIEEVNMFRNDGNVTHFASPRVHGLATSNTFAVYGQGVDKDLTELMPGILSQLGPDSLNSLRKLAESYSALNMGGGLGGMGGGMGGMGGLGPDDDDDVPNVDQNFDEADKDDEEAEVPVASVDELD